MEKLVDDTIKSIIDYLPKVVVSCDNIATLFYQENEEEALEIWSLMLEGIEWITQAFHNIEKLGFSLAINSGELNPYLLEIETALETRDLILAADLIKFEIKPILASWLEKVTKYKVPKL